MKSTHSQDTLELSYPPLLYYKIYDQALAPVWGTADAACFDLSACLLPGMGVKVFTARNSIRLEMITASTPTVHLYPEERAMIPTGLIFDIPVGYDVKIYCRSGVSLKQGLTLANKVGVVDYGYVEESFLVMKNESEAILEISHGDRIAQAQMKRDYPYQLVRTMTHPVQKTDRVGGFGSTGHASSVPI
jgi:dUTP pyrophosphatase